MQINWLDIILLIPIAWAAYKGFSKGFIIEIASLISLVLGVWAAANFSGLVAIKMEELVQTSSQYLPIIAFVITFIGVVFCVRLIAKIIEKAIKIASLGFVNRLAGMAFSLAKVLVIISVGISLIERINQLAGILPETIKSESVLYQPMLFVAQQVTPALVSLLKI